MMKRGCKDLELSNPGALAHGLTWLRRLRSAFKLPAVGLVLALGAGWLAGLWGPQVPSLVSSAHAQSQSFQPSNRLSRREQYCAQLERRLAEDWMQTNQSKQRLPEIQQEIRETQRAMRQAEQRAERANCYEQFLFSKTLRRTRQCLEFDRKIRFEKTKLADLESQRLSATGSNSRDYRQDDMIRELARNGCGSQYEQEARRRSRQTSFFNFWQDRDTGYGSTEPFRERTPGAVLPFATYRTLCVRTCDGYYFPISFSTLPSNFRKDQAECQNRCAAPSTLFIHQNPGGTIEEMATPEGEPYSRIENAFRYRTEFVPGCSCNVTEYDPDLVDGKVAALNPPAPQEGKMDEKESARRRVPISQGVSVQANLDVDNDGNTAPAGDGVGSGDGTAPRPTDISGVPAPSLATPSPNVIVVPSPQEADDGQTGRLDDGEQRADDQYGADEDDRERGPGVFGSGRTVQVPIFGNSGAIGNGDEPASAWQRRNRDPFNSNR